MRNIRLVRINRALTASLENDPAHFEAHYQGKLGPVADLVRQIAGRTMTNVPHGEDESPWGGYLAIDESTEAVVGTCAFKAPPGEDATIEIAYFTFSAYEGQGYATAMARGLIEVARGSSEAKRITARTLPQPNASTKVLEKVGMRLIGEVMDPEDGRVWEWEVRGTA